MQVSPSATLSVDDLAARVRGRVIRPGDADYDAIRQVVSGEFDRRPAALVRVQDAQDVAAVVAFARETGAPLAVRSGGHSGSGHSSVDDGIVIDLRDMRAIEIDLEARTVWAETGCTAADVSTATGAHGLAVGFGDTGSVGIGGITLGGGVGYLARKHGMTINSLLAAEIVTADGQVLRVDADQHPDLFWALRGGGGNFGVATRFRYRLVEVEEFVGGMLFLPGTADVVSGFMREAIAAPESLSVIANVMTCPPMPFIPEEHHGRLIVMAFMAFAGPVEEGQRVLDRFRSLATPLADMTRPMPYHEMYPPEDPNNEYHPTAAARNFFMESFTPEHAALIVERLDASDAPMRVVQLRVLGGAMGRVAPDATAFAHRSHPIMVNVAAFYEGAADKAAKQGWVEFGGRRPADRPGCGVRQLPGGRRSGTAACRVPRRDVGAARRGQGPLRSRQRVPVEPQRRAGTPAHGLTPEANAQQTRRRRREEIPLPAPPV